MKFDGAWGGQEAPHFLMPLQIPPPAFIHLTAVQNPKEERVQQLPIPGLRTNLHKRSIPLSELMGGGPPKDGIPAIDHPKFVSGKVAASWLHPAEPVFVVEVRGEARAYPLQILMWHELVNDVLGGTPVLISYCPLCNTALAFHRMVQGKVLRFGVSGLLRHSDLVMFDRETESLWQQATGEAIVGDLTSENLSMLSTQVLAFDQFQRTYPEGLVLSRDTGFNNDYGRNPYVGYDASVKPRLFRGKPDPRVPAMERLATVSIGGEDKAYSFSHLRRLRMIQDRVGGKEIVVFFAEGTASAVDAKSFADSKDVGSIGVFLPEAEGRALHFNVQKGRIEDQETHSAWDVSGQAVDGPLMGLRLPRVPHATPFAFAWLAFKPKTILFTPHP